MAEILVVDDEEMVRLTVRNILQAVGHTIIEAANGVDALKILTKQCPAIIITDILMPEKEGIETILEIRRGCRNIKIIAMSGGGRAHQMDFLNFAKQAGADRILPKPFSGGQLITAIDELLSTA